MSQSVFHPNSIQPETTITVTAEASEERTPDIAFITSGVQVEADTATEAMRAQAAAMNGVFDALAKAGIETRDMQTSGLSLNPRYDNIQIEEAPGRTRGERQLSGYVASNQLTVKVRNLDKLGATLDSLVEAGGNTFSGLNFGNEDADAITDLARTQAIKNAVARAELYAAAAGMKVGRIVTINEGYSSGPQPMAEMAMMRSVSKSSTPIAGGEVGYTVNVNVMFELVK